MNASPPRIVWEHFGQFAVEPLKDLLKPLQRDALLAVFQTVERGSRNTELPCKAGIRFVTALLAEKQSKLLIKTTTHGFMLEEHIFRMRNICVDTVPDAEYVPSEKDAYAKNYGWIDYVNTALNVTQNVQLSGLQQKLDTLQRAEAERQLKLEEEGRYRRFIVECEVALDSAFQAKMPATLLIAAKSLQLALVEADISPAAFREYSDMDRAKTIHTRLNDAIVQSAARLDDEQRKNAEECARFIFERTELDEMVDLQRLRYKIAPLERTAMERSARLEQIYPQNRSLWSATCLLALMGVIVTVLLAISAVVSWWGPILCMAVALGAVPKAYMTSAEEKEIKQLEANLPALQQEIEANKQLLPSASRVVKLLAKFGDLPPAECIRMREERLRRCERAVSECDEVEPTKNPP